MAKFTKRILKPGKYLVNTPDGRQEVSITKTRLKKWVSDFEKMLSNGLKIPAPWKHFKNAIPIGKDEEGSRSNAGFWEKLFIDEEGYLTGEVDVPLEKDAERVGTTVREVSPMIKPGWKDGLGNSYEEPILHIALVTNPIVPGQDNFQPSKDELAIAMSHLIELADDDPDKEPDKCEDQNEDKPPDQRQEKPTSTASSASVKDAVIVLAKLGLKLPDDTNAQNLVERIVVAGEAVAAQEVEEEEDDTTVAEGTGKEQPPPIAMSEEVMSSNILRFAADKQKADYTARVKALVESGRCTPAYAKKHLTPHIESFELSTEDFNEDGTLIPSALDVRLEALEAQPGKCLDSSTTAKQATSKQKVRGLELAHEEPYPEDLVAELSEEQTDDIVKLQLQMTGRA